MYRYLKKCFFYFFCFFILFASNLSDAATFYVRLRYGILSIKTESEYLFDAIDFDSDSISFNEEVLFLLVGNEFEDPLYLDFLAEEFFNLLSSTGDHESYIFSAGSNSDLEEEFLQIKEKLSKNEDGEEPIRELHEGATTVLVAQDDSSANFECYNPLPEVSSSVPSAQVQQSCMFLCGAVTAGRNNRYHYLKKHPNDYHRLKEKCRKGFVCPLCKKKQISSLLQLGLHINHFHKGSGYYSFLP